MLSLGHTAFFGLGAYTFAILTRKAMVPGAIAIAAVLVVGFGASLLIGFFCVRLSGVHFAMLTLAFGQLVFTIAFKWYGFTGGDNGIQGIPVRPLPGGIEIGSTQAMYYFALVVVGLSVEILRRIRSSPFGATLKSIRENNQRAAYLGVNVKLYQWTAFVVAGAFTGLAGGLYASWRSRSPPTSSTGPSRASRCS
jgi:branched-chain amino acid transport system permease protein